MVGMYHFLVSFKSRGEVARELKFRSHVPFALPDSGTVVESGLIFLSLLFSIPAHSAPVSAARMAILFGVPSHNSSTLLACPRGRAALMALLRQAVHWTPVRPSA